MCWYQDTLFPRQSGAQIAPPQPHPPSGLLTQILESGNISGQDTKRLSMHFRAWVPEPRFPGLTLILSLIYVT